MSEDFLGAVALLISGCFVVGFMLIVGSFGALIVDNLIPTFEKVGFLVLGVLLVLPFIVIKLNGLKSQERVVVGK